MPFIIYPDAATAIGLGQPIGTPVHLGDGEAMRSFVPLAGLVGPDPSEGNAPTTFIRISMLGLPVTADKQPKIELLAHDPSEPNGSPAPPLDPNTAVALAAGVSLFDDVHNPVGAALAYFSPPYLDNVYLLKVAIEIPGTKLWIRISNTTGAARNFVWVVADNDAETRQPWVHATYRDAAPAEITFNASVGQTSAEPAQPIAITNRGTGSLTVSGVNPAIAAPYTMSGLPLTLGPNPNTPATVTVSFDTPSTAGDIPAATFRFITNDNTDPGLFGAGHNNKLILSAHILAGIWSVIKVPDLGEGVAEAELVEWHVKVGDPVRKGALIAAVETDKATVEIASPTEGEVAWLGAKVGDMVAVGSDLARLKIPG